jgi:hypothetical protein
MRANMQQDIATARGEPLPRPVLALSRAKRKMILVASRSIFSLFSPDEETFANALMWKNLLLRTCTVMLWQGERDGRQVEVWGGSRKADGPVVEHWSE